MSEMGLRGKEGFGDDFEGKFEEGGGIRVG